MKFQGKGTIWNPFENKSWGRFNKEGILETDDPQLIKQLLKLEFKPLDKVKSIKQKMPELPAEDPPKVEKPKIKIDYSGLSLDKLREHALKAKLKGYIKYNRKTLIKKLDELQ